MGEIISELVGGIIPGTMGGFHPESAPMSVETLTYAPGTSSKENKSTAFLLNPRGYPCARCCILMCAPYARAGMRQPLTDR